MHVFLLQPPAIAPAVNDFTKIMFYKDYAKYKYNYLCILFSENNLCRMKIQRLIFVKKRYARGGAGQRRDDAGNGVTV